MKQARASEDGSKRGPQFVRKGRQEVVFDAVRSHQLGRMSFQILGHAFEIVDVPADTVADTFLRNRIVAPRDPLVFAVLATTSIFERNGRLAASESCILAYRRFSIFRVHQIENPLPL